MNFRRLRIASFVVLSLLSTAALRDARADDHADYGRLEAVYARTFPAGDFKAADQAARQMLAICRRSKPHLVYLGLSRVGSCRLALGFYREGIEYTSQALDAARKQRPQNDWARSVVIIVTADSFKNLGDAHVALGEYEQAIDWYQQAVEYHRNVTRKPMHQAAASVNLALAYRKMGNRKKAHEVYRQNLAILEPLAAAESRPGDASNVMASLLLNWAILYHVDEARFDLAEPMYKKALKMSVAAYGWGSAFTALPAAGLAAVYMSQSRTAEAEPLLRAALKAQQAELGDGHPNTLLTVAKLGEALDRQGREAEAEPFYRRALAGIEERLGHEHPDLRTMLNMLGSCLMALNRDEEAASYFERAVAICEKTHGPTHVETSLATFWLARFKAQSGEAHASFDLATEVLENHRQNPLPNWAVAELHDIRAVYYWFYGDRSVATAELQKGLDLAEAGRWFSGGAERERASAFEHNLQMVGRMAEWQAELGDNAAVFQAIEARKARTFLDELAMANVDFLAGRTAAERRQAEESERELRTALTAAERRFSELPSARANPSLQATAQRRQAAEEILRAQHALYEHMADIRHSSEAYRQLMGSAASARPLAAVQSLLADGELMLMYTIGWKKSYAMAIRRDSCRLTPLEIDSQSAETLHVEAGPLTDGALEQILQHETAGLLPIISSLKRTEDATGALAALWRVLIPQEERAALTSGDVKLLTVIPDGTLSLLPFETLVVGAEGPLQYLLDAGPPIAYAPSASVMLHLAEREPKAARADEPVLTLGDPAYSNELKPLPYSGTEASWVKRLFDDAGMPALKLTGAQATESRLRGEIAGREIVHLACHGAADSRYGNFFGSLAIAPGRSNDPNDDGVLSMSEIHGLDLAACELAILSACETNYGPQQRGEGVWALSRAFLIAGSRRVAASNWVVDDEAGATLVSYFARHLAQTGADWQSREAAAALHKAKKLVRQQDKWSDPFYWGSLVIIGPK